MHFLPVGEHEARSARWDSRRENTRFARALNTKFCRKPAPAPRPAAHATVSRRP